MYGTPFHRPDDFERVVDYAASCLVNVEFDVLVFRGFSGALIGPTVALRLKKPWALIRKPGDTAHSSRRIEGAISGKYVILDDFVDTGATIHAIVKAVADPYADMEEWDRPGPLPQPRPECVGIVCYERPWALRSADDPTYWLEKLGGIQVLNWAKEISKPGVGRPESYVMQSARVGRMVFPEPVFKGATDYSNLFTAPPMPDAISRLFSQKQVCEEIAF